eukprot:1291878-Pleurochrysis_carterae.AAC.4
MFPLECRSPRCLLLLLIPAREACMCRRFLRWRSRPGEAKFSASAFHAYLWFRSFSFLRVEPWAERAWFQHAFERPFSAQSGPVAATPAPADPSHARTVRKRRLSEPDDGALETTLSQAATGDRAAREGALVSLSEASARAEVVERRTAAHLLLCELFRLMWRSTKRSVEAELGLAAPSVVTHSLAFSSIEAHFYKKQHA